MNKKEKTAIIKRLAAQHGFRACGISPAETLTDEAARLKEWLARRFHASMAYMVDRLDRRVDPRLFWPPARSVVSLAFNYFPGPTPKPQSEYRISKYAFGRDYHNVIRGRLKKMLPQLENEIGPFQSRLCVDSAPIMEKVWAARGGLGWIGKNTILINEEAGSFSFLGEILLDIELEYDRPVMDQCGDCRLCLESCPTGALVDPYILDASRCLSYLTIESGEAALPHSERGHARWIFGCDICQDVCPFNRAVAPHREEGFAFRADIFAMTDDDWHNLKREKFEELFSGSAVKRAGYDRLMRNVAGVDRTRA